MNPKLATSAVMSTGRRRIWAARRAASTPLSPLRRICIIYDINTTPFSTATPKRAMKPTPAEIENGMPRKASANTPPVAAIGTLRKMRSAGVAVLKVRKRITRISSGAAGTAIASRVRHSRRRGNAG